MNNFARIRPLRRRRDADGHKRGRVRLDATPLSPQRATAMLRKLVSWRVVDRNIFSIRRSAARWCPGSETCFRRSTRSRPLRLRKSRDNISPIVSDLRLSPANVTTLNSSSTTIRKRGKADRDRHAAEAQAVQGIVPHPGALFHTESPHAPFRESARLRFSAALEPGARAYRLRRFEPQGLERNLRRQLRLHSTRVPEPDRAGRIQRLVLRLRRGIPATFVRHHPK